MELVKAMTAYGKAAGEPTDPEVAVRRGQSGKVTSMGGGSGCEQG